MSHFWFSIRKCHKNLHRMHHDHHAPASTTVWLSSTSLSSPTISSTLGAESAKCSRSCSLKSPTLISGITCTVTETTQTCQNETNKKDRHGQINGTNQTKPKQEMAVNHYLVLFIRRNLKKSCTVGRLSDYFKHLVYKSQVVSGLPIATSKASLPPFSCCTSIFIATEPMASVIDC